jgi:hypothetical protein
MSHFSILQLPHQLEVPLVFPCMTGEPEKSNEHQVHFPFFARS